MSDEYKETPFHYACARGQLPIVEYLFSKGSNIEAKAIHDSSPLHFASFFDRIPVIKYLISIGANKSVKDIMGKTPYDYAKSDEAKNLLK